MRHCCALLVLGLLVAPHPGLAAPARSGLVLPTGDRLLALSAGQADDRPSQTDGTAEDRDLRRPVLSSLHAVTGVVQTYDGMLTMRVLDAGGREANPLMQPVARNQRAMLGVKVAAAVATVIGTEMLWRDHHRTGAIIASVLANSAMVMVARHNAQVLARLEGR